jgi:hypothetical protein
MHHCDAFNPFKRPVDCGDTPACRLLRCRPHPRLIELHHVNPDGLEVTQLLINRRGEIHRHLRLIGVELI